MFKVLAAVLAVLSAIISITIYTTTLPSVQKQAADNAAAIEQIQSNNSVYYKHSITVDNKYKFQIVNDNEEEFTTTTIKEYLLSNGDIPIETVIVTPPTIDSYFSVYTSVSYSSFAILTINGYTISINSSYKFTVATTSNSFFGGSFTDNVSKL